MRIIIPPLTSNYLNLIKNSSLGVAIAYRDSSNFEYSKDGDGQEMIHPRYANWMRYLVHDIKEQLHDRAANAQDKPS